MVGEAFKSPWENQENGCGAIKAGATVANTATRWVEASAELCFSSQLTNLKKAEAVLPDMDSSCDQTVVEQLSVFARFFDGKTFGKELLCFLPPPGCVTGEFVFDKLKQFFERTGLDMSKILSFVTNGAPSMVGQHEGLVSRLAAIYPALLAFQCIIHKSVCELNCVGKWKGRWILWQDWYTLFRRVLVCNIAFSNFARGNVSGIKRSFAA